VSVCVRVCQQTASLKEELAVRLPSSTLPSQVQPGIASQVAYSVRKSKAAGTRARSQLPRYAFLVDRNRFISAVYSRSHSLCLCFCAVVRLWRRRCTRSWRRLSARLDSRSEHVAAAILAAAMVMAVVRSCTMRRTSQSVACSAVRVAGSRQCRLDVFCLCPSLRRARSLRCGAAGRRSTSWSSSVFARTGHEREREPVRMSMCDEC
jgi:hypothetical protein